MGHKRAFTDLRLMSALPLKEDMVERRSQVRFVPKLESKRPF
jgi:hypothetical protein